MVRLSLRILHHQRWMRMRRVRWTMDGKLKVRSEDVVVMEAQMC